MFHCYRKRFAENFTEPEYGFGRGFGPRRTYGYCRREFIPELFARPYYYTPWESNPKAEEKILLDYKESLEQELDRVGKRLEELKIKGK